LLWPSHFPAFVLILYFKMGTQMTDLICFCFEYTAEDIRQDFVRHGHSTIMERIQKEKKKGTCQCATKNPGGR
jgi:hypothetical protein